MSLSFSPPHSWSYADHKLKWFGTPSPKCSAVKYAHTASGAITRHNLSIKFPKRIDCPRTLFSRRGLMWREQWLRRPSGWALAPRSSRRFSAALSPSPRRHRCPAVRCPAAVDPSIARHSCASFERLHGGGGRPDFNVDIDRVDFFPSRSCQNNLLVHPVGRRTVKKSTSDGRWALSRWQKIW